MDFESNIPTSNSEARMISSNAIEMDDHEEANNPGATKQQKLIKIGLLALLVIIVIYVIIDYTVSLCRLVICNYARSCIRVCRQLRLSLFARTVVLSVYAPEFI